MGLAGLCWLLCLAGTATTSTTPGPNTTAAEQQCKEEAATVRTPLGLLAVLPPLLNLATAGLLGLLWFRVRAIRTANDEVFQSTMLLTRTARRVTIPRRAVEAIQKVIGDPKTALQARLSKDHLQKIKKTN